MEFHDTGKIRHDDDDVSLQFVTSPFATCDASNSIIQTMTRNPYSFRSMWPGLMLCLLLFARQADGAEILWSQYCQHLGKMKLLVHLDTDPMLGADGEVERAYLWIREDERKEWAFLKSSTVDPLTATALFVIDGWPRFTSQKFLVICGESTWEGTFRAEPKDGSTLKLAGLSCHKDIGWPWKEAIAELIAHDPDLVFFSGDQIYENDYNSPMFRAMNREEVPLGMGLL